MTPFILSSDRLQIALEFAAKGFRVYPQTRAKKGFFDDFQILATTDAAQIKGWARTFPKCNWAVMTGEPRRINQINTEMVQGAELQPGILVVDIDIKKNQPGEESLKRLTDDIEPETFSVRTGSGGRHLYFWLPIDLDLEIAGWNFDKIGYKGLEVKGVRTWATLPGAIYDDGREYRIIKNVEPATAPEWLLALCREYKKARQTPSTIEGDNTGKITPGGRNAMLTSFAGMLRKRGLDETSILQRVAMENQHRCDPPLPLDEVKTIAKSVAAYPIPDYDIDDIDDASKFNATLDSRFLWCEKHQCWYLFDCGIWQRDDERMILMQKVKAFVKDCEHDAVVQNDDNAKKHFKAIARNLARMKRIIDSMKSEVAVIADMFDKRDTLLNCRNGTYDLEHSDFYPHRKDELHTKQINAEYKPEAEPPKLWLDFLNEIFKSDKDLILYIQKVLGYSLAGGTGEQEFYILFGQGNNGKSQLIKAYSLLCGGYAHSMSADRIMMSKYQNNDTYMAQLKKIRSLFCSEASDMKTLDSALIKMLTGGEALTVAQKYERPETFEISAKIFLITNHKPTIRDSTEGIWRRVRLIPFDYEVPVEKRVQDFGIKLFEANPSGLLNWLIEGYKLYRIDGLKPPKIVLDHSKEYRNEEDLIVQFIDEKCVRSNSTQISLEELWKNYKTYLEANGQHGTKKRFSRDLKEKKFRMERQGCGMVVMNLRMRGELEMNVEGLEETVSQELSEAPAAEPAVDTLKKVGLI
ncbi:MAG TPA: phage/plasmid primase, P4 family [bacterium]